MKKCSMFLSAICVLGVGLMSCEKEQDTLVVDNQSSEEWVPEDEVASVPSKVLFHKHYDETLSKEEVQAQWNMDYKTWVSKHNKGQKAKGADSLAPSTTSWNYSIGLRTVGSAGGSTDGAVRSRTFYRTLAGTIESDLTLLDNPDEDEFEGGWDYFVASVDLDSINVDYVEVEKARVFLWGTDDWVLTGVSLEVSPDLQTLPASGTSNFLNDGFFKRLKPLSPFVPTLHSTPVYESTGRMTFD